MNSDEAMRVYEGLRSTKLADLLDDLKSTSIRYARIRVDWLQTSIEARGEIDLVRSRAHAALIDACNILSRGMGKLGEDNSWRRQLGDDRARIGDFACHLHCFLGLSAR